MKSTTSIFRWALFAILIGGSTSSNANGAKITGPGTNAVVSGNQDFIRSRSRSLAIGDFEELNSIFRGAVIKLPDATVSQSIIGLTLRLDISNLRCTDIAIGDLGVTYDRESLQRLTFTVDVIQLDLTCYLDYRYNYGLLSGSGSADAFTDNNRASVTISFTSSNFDLQPPTTLDSESCQTNINVIDLDFRGGFVGSILDTFESLIRNTVESAVENVACDELNTLVDESAEDLIALVQDFLDPYLGTIAPEYSDPLYAEKNIVVPPQVSLLDVSDTDSLLGGWFNTALSEIDRLLGTIVDDEGAPSGTGRDLGVNRVLRNTLLDDERAFSLDIAELSSVTDGVVFDMHDKLTQTQIVLESIKIFGLDTFTKFEPLKDIGKYTLQNELAWEYLTIEIDVAITIKPSSLPDSVIANPGAEVVEEKMKIEFGVDNIDAIVSFLLGLDINVLGSLSLGPLLDSKNIVACILSTIFDVELSALGVSIGNIREPTLSGFVSKGIDRVVSTSVEAVFVMYEGILLEALPNMFQTTLRDLLNKDVISKYLDNEGNTNCPAAQFNGSIDFRDLLLAPGAARATGGSGDEPYGDLGSTLRTLVVDQLFTADADGLPSINSVLIAPLTESQSGEAGNLLFPTPLFDFVRDDISNGFVGSFMDRFQFTVFDTRVSNVDTITLPLSLLEPTVNPSTLANLVSVGPVTGRELTGKVRFLLDLDGENSPLSMRNEFDVIVKVPSTVIVTDLFARIDGNAFAQFPVEDMLNGDCWLSLFSPSENQAEPNLGLSSFLLGMFGLSIDVDCISCSSPGTAVLGGVANILDQTGVIDFLRSRVESFVQELVTGEWATSMVDRWVTEAPGRCPHHSQYNESLVAAETTGFEARLTRASVETIILGGVLVVEVGSIVFADSHLKMTRIATSPLSGQTWLSEAKAGNDYLDWSNLGKTLGPLADTVYLQFLDYINGSVGAAGEQEPMLNKLIRDNLLGEDQSLTVDLNGWSISEAGVNIDVVAVKILGLDSISATNLASPIAPQTLKNVISWKNLTLEIDADMTLEEEGPHVERVTFTAGVVDVDIDVSLLLAINATQIGNLELGSMLSMKSIMPCLLSTVDVVEITQFQAAVGSFAVPSLVGFLSPSVQETLNKSIRALLSEYESDLLAAVPIIFDETVRQLANSLIEAFMTESDAATCQLISSSSFTGEVDYRDLFLTEEEALPAGGKGGLPYGDVGPMVKQLIEDELFALDSATNYSKINNALVRPLTESQSGVPGTLRFGNVTGFSTGPITQVGITDISVSLSNALIENLDTIGFPLRVLEPNETSGQLLDNSFTFGDAPNPIRASTKLLLELSGSPGFSMRNELGLSISLGDADVLAGVLARLDEKAFMTFPLRDLSSLTCWLATFVTPELNDDGFRVSSSESAMAVTYLDVILNTLTVNATCLSCTSSGLTSLSDLTQVLRDTGVVDELKKRLVGFSSEILTGDFVQVMSDRLLSEASRRCEHSPDYVENYVAPGYDFFWPALSRESTESAILAATVGVEVAVIILAKSHVTAGVSDPFERQTEITESATTQLLDLSNLSGTIGSWADIAIDELNSYMGGQSTDPETGGTDLGINTWLRSSLLDQNGALAIPLSGMDVPQAGVSAQEVRVFGLDTLTSFEAFDRREAQTVMNKFSWKELRVELDVSFSVLESMNRAMHQMTLSFGLNDVDASVALLLAFDQEQLGSLKIGSLLLLEDILGCLLSTSFATEFTQLSISAKEIRGLEIDGYLSEDTKTVIDDATKTLLATYEDTILAAMPNLFDSTIKALVNNWLQQTIGSQSCPEGVYYDQFLDWRDLLLSPEESRLLGGEGSAKYGDLLPLAASFLDSEIAKVNDNDGIAALNEIIVGPLTNSQSREPGVLTFPSDLLDTSARVKVGGLDATIVLRAYDMRIENLNTVSAPLSLLDPIEGKPNSLNNTASIGVPDRPLTFAFKFLLSLMDGEMELRNELEISLDLLSTTVILEAMLKISEQSFFEFPLRDVLNIDCWLSSIPAPTLDETGVRVGESTLTAALTNLVVLLSEMNLNITCISCTSPDMEELSRLVSSPESSADVTRVANDVLGYLTNLLGGEYAQLQIDRILNEAPKRCPHREEYRVNPIASVYKPFGKVERKDDTITFLIALAVATGTLLFALMVVLSFVKFVVRQRNKAWVKTLPNDVVLALHQSQNEEQRKKDEVNDMTRSMFRSSAIPWYVRLLVPITILGNVGFFLSGHLSLGATVNVEARIAGEEITVEQFFEFSMARSTVDIWNAGGKELAVLILIFSGVWPYTKQLITLFLWFASPNLVSVSTRGSILLWLDALAKWSMVDIFVLIVSVAAFRVSVLSPQLSFLPDGFYSIDLLVVPLWGLYANMIAQLISQVSSHFIIHFHRKTVEVAESEYSLLHNAEMADTATSVSEQLEPEEDNSSESASTDTVRPTDILRSHGFIRHHRPTDETLRVKKGVGSVLVVMSFALSALIVAGCVFPSFSLEALGLIGVAVESGQQFEQAMRNHSVLTIIELLFEEAKFLGTVGDYVGLGTLSALLVVSVLIVPIVQSLVLLRQWFFPLSEKQTNRNAVLLETLQAWQYVEVYVIAIIVSSWQLGPVSEFMINDYCTGLDQFFSSLVYYGVLQPQDAQCFRVQARVETATFMLVAGAILLALLNTIVMKAVRQRDHDRAKLRAQAANQSKLVMVRLFSEEQEAPTAEHIEATRRKILPVPVLFSDTFRWLLLSVPSPPDLPPLMDLGESEEDLQSASEAGTPSRGGDGEMVDIDIEEQSMAVRSVAKSEANLSAAVSTGSQAAYPPGHHPMVDKAEEFERPLSSRSLSSSTDAGDD